MENTASNLLWKQVVDFIPPLYKNKPLSETSVASEVYIMNNFIMSNCGKIKACRQQTRGKKKKKTLAHKRALISDEDCDKRQ